LVRRLLAICAVTLTVLAAFAAARLNQVATVSAASGPSNLVLFQAQSTGGCPLGPAYTFCDQIPGAQGPTENFVISASAAVSGMSVSLGQVPGLATNFAPGDFTITSNSCTGSLAANQQCQIGLAFSPTVAGLRTAAVTVTDAGGDTLTFNIAGTGKNLAIATPGNSCALADNAYTYCPQPVGGASAPVTFTLAAAAPESGVILSLAAIPGLSSEFGSGDFTIATTTCTGALAASASCAVDVEFTPKVGGLRSAELTATDAVGDTTLVYLAGNTTGGLAFNSSTPASNPAACARLNFFGYCNQPTSGSTPSTAYTVTNTSGAQVTGLTITPPLNTTQPPPPPVNFSVTGTSCATTLAANASCTINVAFTPQATGLQQGSVVVTDTAGDIAAINLSGTGDDFNMVIVAGQSQEVTVSQGNSATYMAQLNADGVFGQNGETVTLVCPPNLPEFTTCDFAPCPITPVVGGAVPFKVVIATSTATTLTPPITNPCNSPAASAAPGTRGPNGILKIATNRTEHAPQFPALLAVLAMLGLGALSAWPMAFGRRANWGRVALALVILFGAALAACGKKGDATTSTATPIATTTMNVVASAVDSSGNPISGSRGLQIILDVIKQQATLP
jgi:hypothetical protein